MHKDFFTKQIDRLKKVYSQASLSDERVQVLWERFKFSEESEFHGAITFLIGEYTTQALPGMSRFEEAVGRFKKSKVLQNKDFSSDEVNYFNCKECRDFGWVFSVDLLVHCKCEKSKSVTWEELQKQQKNYDAGKKLFEMAKKRNIKLSLGKELPYDPSKSIAEEDGVTEETRFKTVEKKSEEIKPPKVVEERGWSKRIQEKDEETSW